MVHLDSARPATSPAAQTILLVDDNSTMRKLARRLLSDEGYNVLEAPDGATALRLAAERAPDLILQDLRLPDCDGFELLSRLRELPGLPDVPILAYSGMLNSVAGRIAAVGFDDFLPKPVEFFTLMQAIHRHLEPALAFEPFGKGKRVIVCNHNAVQRKVTRLQLTKLGFEVSGTGDGIDALALARSIDPVAIVADVSSQRLDGFDLCRAIRRDPELHDLPVVLVTSQSLTDADRRIALRVGANAYVSRTTNRIEIIQAIRAALEPQAPAVLPLPELSSRKEQNQQLRAPLEREHSATVLEPLAKLRFLEEQNQQLRAQLERQASLNLALAQRCSMLATKFSVLSAVSSALVQSKDTTAALTEVLSVCLDTIGAAHGAIFVPTPDGFGVHAAIGLDPRSLRTFFGHPQALRQALASGTVIDIDEATVGESAARDVARAVGGRPSLLAPLIRDGEQLGALLLAGKAADVTTEDWRSFAETIAAQVATSLLLTRYLVQAAASEKRYRTLLESASDAIFVVVHDTGVVLEVNAAGEKLLGRPRTMIVGRHFVDFVPAPDAAEPLARPMEGALTALRADGSSVPVEYSSAAMEIDGQLVAVAIVRDVSAQHAVAEQLRLAQRMETIGRFSGGVAHDFNNLLTVVLTCSELLLDGGGDEAERKDEIIQIKKAGERAAALTAQLLAFSRRQVLDPRVLDLNELIDNMGKMLRRVIGEDIDLQIRLSGAPSHVKADPGQLEQVVMNLAVNARDAMPHGGKLVLEISQVKLDETYLRRYGQSRTGPHTLLSVSDSGEGMTQRTMSRIFEPFFTTKQPGTGTGLGLATAYGIIKQTGGDIWVESELGAGTQFKIYLPTSTAAIQEASAAGLKSDYRGTERILLVEDDESVRILARRILISKGYTMLQASSAEGALSELGRCNGELDLLITDMVMTGMSGTQMVTMVRKILPNLKVLFMSGYTDRTAQLEGVDPPWGMQFLQKPFTPQTMSAKVREILDAPSRTG